MFAKVALLNTLVSTQSVALVRAFFKKLEEKSRA
jgi:hypothetical protein